VLFTDFFYSEECDDGCNTAGMLAYKGDSSPFEVYSFATGKRYRVKSILALTPAVAGHKHSGTAVVSDEKFETPLLIQRIAKGEVREHLLTSMHSVSLEEDVELYTAVSDEVGAVIKVTSSEIVGAVAEQPFIPEGLVGFTLGGRTFIAYYGDSCSLYLRGERLWTGKCYESQTELAPLMPKGRRLVLPTSTNVVEFRSNDDCVAVPVFGAEAPGSPASRLAVEPSQYVLVCNCRVILLNGDGSWEEVQNIVAFNPDAVAIKMWLTENPFISIATLSSTTAFILKLNADTHLYSIVDGDYAYSFAPDAFTAIVSNRGVVVPGMYGDVRFGCREDGILSKCPSIKMSNATGSRFAVQVFDDGFVYAGHTFSAMLSVCTESECIEFDDDRRIEFILGTNVFGILVEGVMHTATSASEVVEVVQKLGFRVRSRSKLASRPTKRSSPLDVRERVELISKKRVVWNRFEYTAEDLRKLLS